MKSISLFIIFLLGITISFAQTSNPSNGDSFPKASQFANSKFTYKIFESINKTYGYDINADGKLMIHQPSVPSIPGNNGFKNKSDAIKVAEFVIIKIKKGEMPPSVTNDELKKLNIIK